MCAAAFLGLQGSPLPSSEVMPPLPVLSTELHVQLPATLVPLKYAA